MNSSLHDLASVTTDKKTSSPAESLARALDDYGMHPESQRRDVGVENVDTHAGDLSEFRKDAICLCLFPPVFTNDLLVFTLHRIIGSDRSPQISIQGLLPVPIHSNNFGVRLPDAHFRQSVRSSVS